jgi:hypothetical protein
LGRSGRAERGTLDRPAEFPEAGSWGYEASYATWYAVAAWDFEHP